MNIKEDEKERQRIAKTLDAIKKQITELGHDYIQIIPKPIPLEEFVRTLQPWGELEKVIDQLKTKVLNLPF